MFPVRIVQVERQICLQSHNIKHIQKLNIQHTGIKLNELARSVRKKLCHSFLNYWNKKSKEPEGKLDTVLECMLIVKQILFYIFCLFVMKG
jgi:DNA-binding transcriptional regulator WhiA